MEWVRQDLSSIMLGRTNPPSDEQRASHGSVGCEDAIHSTPADLLSRLHVVMEPARDETIPLHCDRERSGLPSLRRMR